MENKTNDISRVRSEVRQISNKVDKYFEAFSAQVKPETEKVAPFVGGVTGNYLDPNRDALGCR